MIKNWRWGNNCSGCGVKAEGKGLLPLSAAAPGKRVKVASIAGGRCLCARMAAMGIYPGVEMELVCTGCGSPCLIRVHGGTLSLGVGVSQKIMVAPTAS